MKGLTVSRLPVGRLKRDGVAADLSISGVPNLKVNFRKKLTSLHGDTTHNPTLPNNDSHSEMRDRVHNILKHSTRPNFPFEKTIDDPLRTVDQNPYQLCTDHSIEDKRDVAHKGNGKISILPVAITSDSCRKGTV